MIYVVSMAETRRWKGVAFSKSRGITKRVKTLTLKKVTSVMVGSYATK